MLPAKDRQTMNSTSCASGDCTGCDDDIRILLKYREIPETPVSYSPDSGIVNVLSWPRQGYESKSGKIRILTTSWVTGLIPGPGD